MQSGTHVGDRGSRPHASGAMDGSDMKPRLRKRVKQYIQYMSRYFNEIHYPNEIKIRVSFIYLRGTYVK